MMLEPDELADVAAAFGVADEQVRRDHLISHILAAVAPLNLAFVFFGGTALGRTHLTDPAAGARLSEDIDLYSPERRDTAAAIDQRLPSLLRREFPRAGWDPPLSSVRSADAAQFVSADGIRVRLQLLDSRGEHQDLARWPVELIDVRLRYRDVRATVTMHSPTLPAFAAMKTVAWADRRAARDLYDLAGLARIGALTRDAAVLVREAVGWSVTPSLFADVLVPHWEVQLAHQTRVLPSAVLCLAEVRRAYADALNGAGA
jgi:hypothetical protein